MSLLSNTFTLVDGYVATQHWDGYAGGANNLISRPVWMRSCDSWSLVLSWPTTGSPVGTFYLQMANDMEKNYPSGNLVSTDNPFNWTWVTLANISGTTAFTTSTGAVSPAASTNTSLGFNSADFGSTGFRWFRVLYVRTSGSITISGKMTVKGVQ